MAITVDQEVVVTAQNQRYASGGGLVTVYKDRCPDLFAATLPATGVNVSSDAPVESERLLPIGWKVQYLVDLATGADAGARYIAPNGKTWDAARCSNLPTTGFSWTWIGVVGIGAFFIYLYTKKRK